MDNIITKKMVILSVIFLNILFGSNILAYHESNNCAVSECKGFFMLGRCKMDIDSLNSNLKSKGYSPFSEDFNCIGGGGYRIIRKFIIGGEGCGFFKQDTSSQEYEASIHGGYGFFNFGYKVYSLGSLNIYPFLGIGGGGMTLTIKEKDVPSSFSEVLENPKRAASISTGTFLINLSIGADYLLKLSKKGPKEGGVVFGIRIGYVFSPFKNRWTMDEKVLSDAPQISIGGPYIRFMLGGGCLNP